MKITNIIIIVVLIFSGYQGYKQIIKKYNSTDKDNAPAVANQNPRDKNKKVLPVKSAQQHVMDDKRINPIAGESKHIDVNNPQKNDDPIRNRVPKNLERILQYEMNVWSRGLDEEEISNLQYIWGKYASGEKFSSSDKDILDALETRNILNAIRVSKPSIIKSKEDLQRAEDVMRQGNQSKGDDYNADSYDDQSNEDIYNSEDSYRENIIEVNPRDEYNNDSNYSGYDDVGVEKTLEAPVDETYNSNSEQEYDHGYEEY